MWMCGGVCDVDGGFEVCVCDGEDFDCVDVGV